MSLQIILFVVLIVGPILLAWFKGDTLLNYLEGRRQAKKQRRRQRSTRALPVRETIMDKLLQVETKRNHIESRIGEALAHFRQVTENGRALTANKAAAVILDDLEKVVLSRESMCHDYLDTACLQSDTIEVMTKEVSLLREVAELERQVMTPRTGAAMHLLETLKHAEQKRVQVDQRLKRLGQA